jgi:hypothetical protein
MINIRRYNKEKAKSNYTSLYFENGGEIHGNQ